MLGYARRARDRHGWMHGMLGESLWGHQMYCAGSRRSAATSRGTMSDVDCRGGKKKEVGRIGADLEDRVEVRIHVGGVGFGVGAGGQEAGSRQRNSAECTYAHRVTRDDATGKEIGRESPGTYLNTNGGMKYF
ncbi:hypothetical protein B0H19DRAFT_1063128 [Mycena capillaripes]|nr:hypothetical protein B0H19DRAFT_1063128 [Mycena capillaripes]